MDVLAILIREPFSGVTRESYLKMTDREILEVYLAPRDKEFQLIPWHKRHPGDIRGPSGHPDLAAAELPSVEQLKIPSECLRAGPPIGWVSMFWQVWRSRTNPEDKRPYTTEWITRTFWKHLGKG